MDSTRSETPQPQYLKLEDLQSAGSPATTVFDSTAGTQQSPASVVIHSRPAKKRKSWGQELPQPKTNLPPRKRAKTDDEKEQRRIERIKRNRAAAHNSRERKRQETENLAVLLARARAELDAYKRLHGPLPADIVLPEVTLNKDPESPGRSTKYSDDASTYMPSPAISLLDSNISIKQEPLDNNTVSPMAMFEDLDSKSSPSLPTLDVTQHSAVMLCDLPCPSSLRSARTRRQAPLSTTQTSSRQSSISQAYHAWWARLFLYHIHLHILNACRSIMLAMWTLSPSRTQALITRALAHSHTRTASPTTPSSSTISSTRTPSRLLPLTQLLAQRKAATGRGLRQQGALVALARRFVANGIGKGSGHVVAEDVSSTSSRNAECGHDATTQSASSQTSTSTGALDGRQH